MGRISALTELTSLASNDYLIVLDSSANIAKKISVANAFGVPDTTWVLAGESWTYSSYSSTTKLGVITVPSDATTKYAAGMRIKITQSTGGTKYGVIKSLTSTALTVFFDTYTLNNEAITSPSYSSLYLPYGIAESHVDGRLRADYATVATDQTTTSTTYVNLATVGPSVTVNIGPSGKAIVILGVRVSNNTANNGGAMSLEASGANTIATGTYLIATVQNGVQETGRSVLLEGLNTGETTFTVKYRVYGGSGTATFGSRELSVIPL